MNDKVHASLSFSLIGARLAGLEGQDNGGVYFGGAAAALSPPRVLAYVAAGAG